ncbi:hypothetical protein [Methylobacterium sp. Leaf117]|uniref:hypothetical protein n=1 Tax=Methylobacterium sp. Leaf117 TaxID=1736260 RepID=UPI0006F6CB92|nr:hypothetical protein [Methylobacterium sp. Leaf117]KQP89393.1 hypothetical protein ASF57_23840 [Methylobacterium sp. Leaf117]
MSGPSSRRGFLSGLAALLLIGGGVSLIGRPTAVAAPVTDQMMTHYLGFISREFRELMVKMDQRHIEKSVAACVRRGDFVRPSYAEECKARTRYQLSWMDFRCLAGEGELPVAAPPSSRAALVLSTVGCK